MENNQLPRDVEADSKQLPIVDREIQQPRPEHSLKDKLVFFLRRNRSSLDGVTTETHAPLSHETIPSLRIDNLIHPDADGYRPQEGFQFPVLSKANTEAEYIKIVGAGVYTHPTEPYQAKEDFLRTNGIDKKRNIVTVVGGNWPLLYADITDGEASVIGVDQNLEQIKFLEATIFSDKDFISYRRADYKGRSMYQSEVPFYPAIQEKRSRLDRGYRLDPNGKEAAHLERIRTKAKGMIANQRLGMVQCDVQDITDMNLQDVDFIDLSNVPELIGVEQTQRLIDSLKPGTQIYMAGILGQLFNDELLDCAVVATQVAHRVDSSRAPGVSMVLLEKTSPEA